MTTENTAKAEWQKGGPSPNPGGRPRKSDEERAGEEYLRERTLGAAKRLVALQDSENEKVALGACIAHLKLTLERPALPPSRDDEYAPLTTAELKAIARAQLQKETAH